MTPEQANALLKPFPPSQIQQLPKGGVKLDYVSHANVTQRLLEVDPHWTWTPVAFGSDGLPKLDDENGLWIYLTVCDVTRLGYGEATGGYTHADKIKSAIGDAIRNAAMRFGVALALWQKESHAEVSQNRAETSSEVPYMAHAGGRHNDAHMASEKQLKFIRFKLSNLGYTGDLANAASGLLGREIVFEQLTSQQASWVIEKLNEMESPNGSE